MIRRFQNALKTVKNLPKKFCPGTMLNENSRLRNMENFLNPKTKSVMTLILNKVDKNN